MKFLNLSFIPRSPSFGLLIMRLVVGLTMLLQHGLGKFQNFETMAPKFVSLFGIPSNICLGLAVFAELVCSGLLVIGLLTRFAALNLAITMGVAFFVAHSGQVGGDKPGELALIYLVSYVTLFFTGAGSFSVDRE
tara:strand:+ start:190 stop:594 length:405 start_codon:yes stop_codon:yes gene_type:complete